MDREAKSFLLVAMFLGIVVIVSLYISMKIPYPYGNKSIAECEALIRDSINQSAVDKFCQSKGYNYGSLKVDVLCVGLKGGKITYEYYNISEVFEDG